MSETEEKKGGKHGGYVRTTREVTLHVQRTEEPFETESGQKHWDVESVTLPAGAVVAVDDLPPYQREKLGKENSHISTLLEPYDEKDAEDVCVRFPKPGEALSEDPLRSFRGPHPESPMHEGDAYPPPIGAFSNEGAAESVGQTLSQAKEAAAAKANEEGATPVGTEDDGGEPKEGGQDKDAPKAGDSKTEDEAGKGKGNTPPAPARGSK